VLSLLTVGRHFATEIVDQIRDHKYDCTIRLGYKLATSNDNIDFTINQKQRPKGVSIQAGSIYGDIALP